MSSDTLPHINEYAIALLIRDTGCTRDVALKAYRTASGDFPLAKQALCKAFATNQKRLAYIQHRAKEDAYRREQARYQKEVSALKERRKEESSVARLKARCLAFQIRVAIDTAFSQEDYLEEPIGRLVEGLCHV
jgi:hypothetical protein